MSIVVDIILLAFIALGGLAGWKKGLLKSLIGFIGVVAIVIVSYTLKNSLANFLIDTLPFFNFGGVLSGLGSINILFYHLISFIVIFVILYAILNIILTVTGFIDTLLKFTVIWILPSKIGGAIIGLLEAWVYIFLVLFVLSQFSFTNALIKDSTIKNVVLDHTPVVGTYLSGAKVAAEKIYEGIDQFSKDKTKDKDDINLFILQTAINYGLITKEKAQELMDIGKIELENIMFGKGDSLWLSI